MLIIVLVLIWSDRTFQTFAAAIWNHIAVHLK